MLSWNWSYETARHKWPVIVPCQLSLLPSAGTGATRLQDRKYEMRKIKYKIIPFSLYFIFIFSIPCLAVL